MSVNTNSKVNILWSYRKKNYTVVDKQWPLLFQFDVGILTLYWDAVDPDWHAGDPFKLYLEYFMVYVDMDKQLSTVDSWLLFDSSLKTLIEH